jgi:MFS family permease
MFATLSTAWVLPGVMGPAIAGFIGETFDWRWVFLGLLPLIAVATAIAYPAIRKVGAPDAAAAAEAAASASFRRRFPLALLVAGGTGLLLAGMTSGTTASLVLLGVAGLALGLPALRALTPAGTLRAARGLPAAVLTRGILTFAFFAVDAYVALALVDVRGVSATEAGISLTAATLTWTTGSWIQARWSNRVAPEHFVRAGFLVVIVGLSLFSVLLLPWVPTWVAIPTFGVAGLGMGLAYAPLTLIVLKESPDEEHGSASAALSLLDSLGTALGTGMTGALVAASVRTTGSPLDGLVQGFAVAIGVGVVGLALSSRLRARRAAAPVAGPAVVARS